MIYFSSQHHSSFSCNCKIYYLRWDFVEQNTSDNVKEFINTQRKKKTFHHCVSRLEDRTQCEAMMGKRRSDRLKVTGWQMCPWKETPQWEKNRGGRIKSLCVVLFVFHQTIYRVCLCVCYRTWYLHLNTNILWLFIILLITYIYTMSLIQLHAHTDSW